MGARLGAGVAGVALRGVWPGCGKMEVRDCCDLFLGGVVVDSLGISNPCKLRVRVCFLSCA